jgi:hypothetical protein
VLRDTIAHEKFQAVSHEWGVGGYASRIESIDRNDRCGINIEPRGLSEQNGTQNRELKSGDGQTQT